MPDVTQSLDLTSDELDSFYRELRSDLFIPLSVTQAVEKAKKLEGSPYDARVLSADYALAYDIIIKVRADLRHAKGLIDGLRSEGFVAPAAE
jgi:hypothetical protein